MELRAAEPRDADTIAENHHAAWQVGYRGLIDDRLLDRLDLDARVDRWRQYLDVEQPGHAIVVAEVDGEVRGHVAVGPPSRPEDGGGEIISLYVAPASWGHGLGRALLVAGREALVELGYDPLWLWVLDGNTRAHALYESDGWFFDGARQRSILNEVDFGIDELRMRWSG